jgi:predicted DCC family thiol-disulfide oxidoreductase YuxK
MRRRPLVLCYDGGCGMCSGSAAWLAGRDRLGRLRPVMLGDAPCVPPDGSWPDSVVALIGGRPYFRSAAVAAALRRLPPPWPLAGALIRLAPPGWADAIYRLIARHRRRISDVCGLRPHQG